MATATRIRKINYPSSDGKPMAETEVHYDVLTYTVALLRGYYAHRDDLCIYGNLLVYYEEGNPKKCLAPDLFISFGVPRKLRKTYKVWEEGKYPDIVMEFTSAKTRKEDNAKKFSIYQDIWKVKEYFLFDPETEYLKPSLRGYRWVDGVYEAIPAESGRLVSGVLGMTLERHLRAILFRDANTGEPILTEAEREFNERQKLEREVQLLKAQIAELKKHSPHGHG